MDEQQQLISYFDKFRAEILEKLNYDSTRELLSDERKVRLAHAYLDIVSEGWWNWPGGKAFEPYLPHEVMSDRKDCRLSSITHPELADDCAHMAFDGFSRDEKGLRDSFIGKPSDNCIENL